MSIYIMADGPIKFPGLGITLEHLIEGFEFFGIHVSLYGILVGVALFLGLFLTERLAKKTEQNTEFYLELAIRLVLAGVLGGRIGYVMIHADVFLAKQENVFNISSGMSFTGAIIAGMIASFVYCQKRQLSWLKFCDTAVPGIVFGQILGSVGKFIERSSLGTYSDGIFAMQVNVQDVDSRAMKMGRSIGNMIQGDFMQVHPLALYEVALYAVLFGVVLFMYSRNKINGVIFSIYLVCYGIFGFTMEFIRLDSMRMIGNLISPEHIACLLLAMFGTMVFTNRVVLHKLSRKERPRNFFTK